MGILWVIIIGFVAGLIARWLAPGPNNPVGSSDHRTRHRRSLRSDIYRSGRRLVPTGPGRRPDRSDPRRRRCAVRLASSCREPHDQRSWQPRAGGGTWPTSISLTRNVLRSNSLASPAWKRRLPNRQICLRDRGVCWSPSQASGGRATMDASTWATIEEIFAIF